MLKKIFLCLSPLFVSLADLRGQVTGLFEPRLRLSQLQEHECLGRRVLHGARMGAPKAAIVLRGEHRSVAGRGEPIGSWSWTYDWLICSLCFIF